MGTRRSKCITQQTTSRMDTSKRVWYVPGGDLMLIMKFKKKDSDHTSHHFVVDKSNTFSVCSICGVRQERKIIGWDTKDDWMWILWTPRHRPSIPYARHDKIPSLRMRLSPWGGWVCLMTAPPDPSVAGDGGKCPMCGKPRLNHSYEEQKACYIKKMETEEKENKDV